MAEERRRDVRLNEEILLAMRIHGFGIRAAFRSTSLVQEFLLGTCVSSQSVMGSRYGVESFHTSLTCLS